MPYDVFVLKAVAAEMEKKLVRAKARVTKTFQINPTDVLILFRSELGNSTLFISIHPTRGRVNLTERHYSRPPSPTPFAMLLRKHLLGSKLLSIRQPPLERVLYLDFVLANDGDRETQKTLVAEIMGRHSNLILLDKLEEGKGQRILGALKHMPPAANRYRTILPNYTYYPPPLQEKLHPFALDFNHFQQEMSRLCGSEAEKALLENIQGLSPFLAREIVSRAGVSSASPKTAQALWEKLQELLEIYTGDLWEPVLFFDKEEKPLDFSAIRPHQSLPGRTRYFDSISQLLDEFYAYKEKVEEKERLRLFLTQQAQRALQRSKKKEKIQLTELERAKKAEHFRLLGELLLINLKDIPEKCREVELENIWSEKGEKIKIPLDPSISPSSNAQRYFRNYRKAKQGEQKISTQLKRTRQEIAYWENVLFSLEKADLQTLREIQQELVEEGYLPSVQKPKPSVQAALSKPLKFLSSQGEEIYVGRNNRQNEYLSLRFAAKTDYWFHVKDMPGAHVILKSAAPDEESIKEAALLAAYFSRGTHSSNVPVDYTQVKNLRRPPGAPPGMLVYDNYRTIFVTPDEKALEHFLKG